jgi:hypothetical protein
MIAQETHWKALAKVISLTDKPILELGAGDCSTKQIHDLATNHICTVETDSEWMDKFKYLENSWHCFMDYMPTGRTHWGVVFIDLFTYEDRVEAIRRYANQSDYIVIHDAESLLFKQFISDFSEHFKWWIEFGDEILNYPSTLVASNTIDLTDFKVEGMYVINRNK